MMEADVASRPQSDKPSTASSFSASQASISRPTSRAGSKHGRRPNGSAGSRPTTGLNSVPPEYLRPVVKSAVRRWKKLHEQTMIERLVHNKEERRQTERREREEAHKLARRIPVDLLAREWLNLERATIETRAYLIDNLLPYVTLGLEQLLKTVMQRGLAEDTPDANFNPINFLAQYLMRNNPRYSNLSEASPYIRGLRRVGEELRQEMFQLNDNKLAKLKAAAKKKREEKEQLEHKEKLEVKKRKDEVQELFDEFLVGDNVRVDLATLQSAVKSFTEVAEHFPDDVKKHLLIIYEIEITQDATRKLSRKEFGEYIDPFIEEMPGQVFEQFCLHLRRCALAYKAAIDKEDRKNVLTNLFLSCDHDGIGLLDRQRILALFEKFYEQATGEAKNMMRNPTKWPVREVEEELRSYPPEPPPDLDFEEEEEPEPKPAPDAEEAPAEPESAPEAGEAPQDAGEEAEAPAASAEDAPAEEAPAAAPAAVEEAAEPAEAPDAAVERTGTQEEAPDANQSAAAEEKEEAAPEEAAQPPADAAPAPAEEKGAADQAEKEKAEEAVPEAEEAKEEVKEEKEEANEEAKEEAKEEEEPAPSEAKEETEPAPAEAKEEAESAPAEATEGEKKAPEEADIRPPEKSANVERLALDSARPVTSVTFAEGTEFEREKTGLSSRSLETARSQSSVFDEQNLDVTQFVQVTETFLGDSPDRAVLNDLVQFIRDGYQETEEERMARLMKAHRQAMSAKRKRMIDLLFEKWDNDGSGYLEMDELEAALLKYKDGSYKKAINAAKRDLRQKARFHDNRLTKREFRQFLYGVCRHFGDEDGLEFLIEFLIQSVERSYAERVRGDARKKWLAQITLAAETGGASMEPVYRAVFQALYKDAEAHGEGKRISANIAMLEGNDVQPDRGSMLLRYVAATPDDAPFMIGRLLFKDGKNVSFQAVESGKPIHVPRVSTSPGVVFWNPDRKDEDKEGSFIVVPLKDQKKRVFGTLGVDTLNDPQSKSIFITHEIQFFQGIAKAFSIAYHYVDVQRKTLRVAESALSWICRRSPSVHNVTYYMKEPDSRAAPDSYVLRRMLYTDERGDTSTFASPARLERRDNLFRDYLFKAADTSESISSDAYGERHLAIPLRDLEGLAVAVVDIGIGALRSLPAAETKEVMKMLRLLQMAYSEISRAAAGEESSLDGDGSPGMSNAELMFDKLMLVDLRENVAHLDAQAYSELRSYKQPPRTVHCILQAVLAIFHPEQARAGEFADWDRCKKFVTVGLSKKILNYEPQAQAESAPLELIMEYLNEVPHNMVEKHGSKPARYLYNWVFVCVSLIEHTRKMRENKKQDTLPPVPEESEEQPHE